MNLNILDSFIYLMNFIKSIFGLQNDQADLRRDAPVSELHIEDSFISKPGSLKKTTRIPWSILTATNCPKGITTTAWKM